MGYFNYFIKCIIRNITYKLFKPKVFLTVLLSVFILVFCLNTFGYCTDDSGSIDNVVTVAPNATNNDNLTIQFDNTFLNLREIQEQQQLDFITNMYVSYARYPEQTVDFIESFFGEILNSSDDYLGIYIFKGDSDSGNRYVVNTYRYGGLEYDRVASYFEANYHFSNCTYMKGKFWTRYVKEDGSFVDDTVVVERSVPYPFLKVLIPEWKQMFIDFGIIETDYQSEVLEKLDTLISQTIETDNEIANKIEEGNKLQQEQNDFLKQESSDSDVSVDGFNSIDSNDITSDGLTGVFTNIYNSITSWNAKNINLPIPYTDKNIVIPANYTENMLSSFGGSWIITFISSIYYFIVARFIIYSITSIINSIKSGSILETDSKNNITTDML